MFFSCQEVVAPISFHIPQKTTRLNLSCSGAVAFYAYSLLQELHHLYNCHGGELEICYNIFERPFLEFPAWLLAVIRQRRFGSAFFFSYGVCMSENAFSGFVIPYFTLLVLNFAPGIVVLMYGILLCATFLPTYTS